ncbi:MAG: nucleotidyltransferase domain-containing protein [Clostridia bacterium]|nr:nucleotidyltransferase domain-containing protein [Clostridia bacterium]
MEQDKLKALEMFFNKQKVLLAYLFGSQVSSRTGPISDYDIAVLLPQKSPLAYKYQLTHQICELLNTSQVDLVILNKAPVELQYNVISSGKIIFAKDKYTKVEFEADTLSRYFDYLPILRKQREDIIKGGNYATRVQRSREALRKTEKLLKRLRSS